MTVEGAALGGRGGFIDGKEEQQEDEEDMVRWFERVAEEAGQAQTETLRRIIETNRGTEYLQQWLGNDILHEQLQLDPAAVEALYTSRVPLASHADLQPYIQRIADGDASPVLTRDPITMLSLSSGTTDGRPKYVPFTRFSSQSTLQIYRLAAAYRSRAFPIRAGGRVLEFVYSSKQFRTKGGLKAGTATTHYFASEEFKTKQRSTKSFTCSPYEVISSGDYKQSTYCHLLLGLLFCDEVEFVASTFAYSIVQALAALEDIWEELCGDLRSGSLSPRITCPQMRRAVSDNYLISPNPSLASKIEERCKKLKSMDWMGLIPELWPSAKYVYSIMTGSMEPYLKRLRHYAGELALVCADYGSSESWIGVNLDPFDPPEKVTFTVIPTFGYFEFIPLYRGGKKEDSSTLMASSDDFVEGQPLPMSQVKVGQQYEIVLTTYTGLYRYRLGDVVEVAGFYKGAPNLRFICRRKLILTVNIDKNTERDLQVAVEKGRQVLELTSAGGGRANLELEDFTSHAEAAASDGGEPGHYVVYWELRGSADGMEMDRVLEACSREMDRGFVDHGYVVARKANAIGPLELRVVEKGTFQEIMEYYLGMGATASQFKTPRCTTNPDLLRILDQATIKCFWSTAYMA